MPAWAFSALILLFVVGMVLAFSNATVTLADVSPSLVAVLTMPLLITAGTAAIVVYTAFAWRRRYWGLFGRLHFSPDCKGIESEYASHQPSAKIESLKADDW